MYCETVAKTADDIVANVGKAIYGKENEIRLPFADRVLRLVIGGAGETFTVKEES